MRKAHNKKIFLFLLTFFITINTLSTYLYAANERNFTDISTHWAKDSIEAIRKRNLISGYIDDTFKPNNSITRAESAQIINIIFDFKEESNDTILDVSKNAWYENVLRKMLATGIMFGDNKKMRPNDNITKEEAIVVLARAFNIDPGNNNNFLDSDKISSWAKTSVDGFYEAGFIKGFEGKFNPKSPITRAEFISIINNLLGNYIDSPSNISKDIKGNVFIKSGNVNLSNLKVDGNLYVIAPNEKDKINLSNVMVTKKLIFLSGDLSIDNSDINELRSIQKGTSLLAKNSKFKNVIGNNGDLIFDSSEKDNITINKNSIVIFKNGNKIKNDVNLNGGTFILEDNKTSVDKVLVNGPNSKIINNGFIKKIVSNSSLEISGDGKIGELDANHMGIKSSIEPDNLVVANGVTVEIKAKKYMRSFSFRTTDSSIQTSAPTVSTTSPSTSSSNYSNSGNGSSSSNTASPSTAPPTTSPNLSTYSIINMPSEIKIANKVYAQSQDFTQDVLDSLNALGLKITSTNQSTLRSATAFSSSGDFAFTLTLKEIQNKLFYQQDKMDYVLNYKIDTSQLNVSDASNKFIFGEVNVKLTKDYVIENIPKDITDLKGPYLSEADLVNALVNKLNNSTPKLLIDGKPIIFKSSDISIANFVNGSKSYTAIYTINPLDLGIVNSNTPLIEGLLNILLDDSKKNLFARKFTNKFKFNC